MKLPALTKSGKRELPLVPLRELVVFPHMVVPFFAGNPESVKAIEESMNHDRQVFLVCQKGEAKNPGRDDLYQAGTISKVLQMLKLPDGTTRVLAEGLQRGIMKKYDDREGFRKATVIPFEDSRNADSELKPLLSTIKNSFENYSKLQKKVPKDTLESIQNTEYPDKLVDLICANTGLKSEKKVEILGIDDTRQRLETLAVQLEAENEIISLQNKISGRVKKKMEQNQKEYYLNEQIRQINKELGRDEEDTSGSQELIEKYGQKNPPQEILDKAEKESKRLSRLQPMSPESGVLRTYLEWLADLPWSNKSEDNRDINRAEAILNEDHYDMQKPKERVLDFLAVRQLQDKAKGPILCFTGPPGTGKTSLGRSIARALNRDFVRMSLGGTRDEAEIRGHRRTYIGAMPGKIIQSMKTAGKNNPVIIMDEIDKLGSDFRGDPSSALLEVLDPVQNNSFVDHYLGVPFDLSKVFFVTTANYLDPIPAPLKDRMEVIRIPGYTEEEKLKITEQY